ncbi:MAG: YceD family protein [Prochlorotrichaceae cyanobacterium]
MSQSKIWIPDRLPPVVVGDLLRMAEQTLRLEIEGYFADLETLTPIQASLTVTHQGTFLKVTGVAEAIVTLTCDRCLGNYNYRLAVDADELIWLQPTEDHLLPDFSEEWVYANDLVETLPAGGQFDLAQWLYEQLCLTLPHQQLCDTACPGADTPDQPKSTELIDHRWAALAKLKP